MQYVERLALVCWSYGVIAVSGARDPHLSTGTPSRSAARMASAVWTPWPISTELVSTLRLPSSFSLTVAVEVDGVTCP